MEALRAELALDDAFAQHAQHAPETGAEPDLEGHGDILNNAVTSEP